VVGKGIGLRPPVVPASSVVSVAVPASVSVEVPIVLPPILFVEIIDTSGSVVVFCCIVVWCGFSLGWGQCMPVQVEDWLSCVSGVFVDESIVEDYIGEMG
jgi:hypothetical protein